MLYTLLPPLPTDHTPDQILAEEQGWLRDCARDGQPRAHLWQAPQCLIVTRKDTLLPRYQAACEQLAREGWPVHVRDSGGTAVPHGPGILNLSLLLPRTAADLAHYYRLLGAPLLALLGEHGLEGSYDFVPGSFCDGQYNLVIEGRKVTGTAQRWLAPGQDHGGAVLAQAMLLVAGDVDEGTRMASRFYELAGGELRFLPDTSTTLANCIGWRGSEEQLVAQVRRRLQARLTGN
ncbi:lipoyl protein ligase domain-containing protein [Aeromonas sp. BIGb0445]|uniref:lipoyl protein ligase domain-containing protein n=1 Tax=Aeromonas sp. BIGb0445 TaxID=2940593 RepID=UPI00216A562B|nr:protein ligase [Aeromonas sp. BIGb0445]MCS3458228.1 lipoate-protein ligase A [Aeromonas sp. BIGb0445]